MTEYAPVAHVAAYKAHKAGANTPVFFIGAGTRWPYWQCGTPFGPYTFTIYGTHKDN
jgi:hypothetical protein